MPEIITRAEAQARGLKRYFTGKPCPHGHLCERFVCGCACSECHRVRCRERAKLYRRNHLEEHALRLRSFRLSLKDHPEKVNLESATKKRMRDRERRRKMGDLLAFLRIKHPNYLKEFGLS